MPKMKTKSAAKKRFQVTGSGKLKRKHAYHGHILTKKSQKRKRNLDHTAIVEKADEKVVKQMLLMYLIKCVICLSRKVLERSEALDEKIKQNDKISQCSGFKSQKKENPEEDQRSVQHEKERVDCGEELLRKGSNLRLSRQKKQEA